jgi:hypothetical protein
VRLKPGSELHQCAQCAYWEPALTYFGEPTGQGGCRFTPARNRKGDRPRECDRYQEGKRMEAEVKPTEVKELDSLVHFWKDSLAEHRLLMSPSAVYLVEQTIKSLETLANLAAGGLFAARLNNGDWMVGKASYIYQLDITRDHHADPNLSISADLAQAVQAARAKLTRAREPRHAEPPREQTVCLSTE